MSKCFNCLLLCILSLLACSKNNDEKQFNLDPDGLKYIQLRQDQYFIYKDSASGSVDSVVVTESSHSTETYSDANVSGKRHVFSLTLTRKNLSGDSTWLKGTAKAEPYLSHLVRLADISGEYQFVYPPSCLCTNIYKLPSLTIEGKTYPDVIVFQDAFKPGYRFDYYWAPSVGIIKVRKFEGPLSNLKKWTYTLVRHN